MAAGAQLPGNGQTAQLERIGREDPLGPTQPVRAYVEKGVTGGGPHTPAEVGQGVVDPLGEHTVVTGQMTRGDPAHRVRQIWSGAVAGVVREQGRLHGLVGWNTGSRITGITSLTRSSGKVLQVDIAAQLLTSPFGIFPVCLRRTGG